MAQKKIENKLKIITQTPTQQKLRDKTITAQKWASMVKSGDWINRGGPGSDTLPTMEALAARFGEINNIEIWNQAIMLGQQLLRRSRRGGEAPRPPRSLPAPHPSRPPEEGVQSHGLETLGWSLGMDHEYARFYRKDKAKRVMDWGVQACAVRRRVT